jgi:parvulin-like peptidyl-prolyl isomerase
MRRVFLIFALAFASGITAPATLAQSPAASAATSPVVPGVPRSIDGVAARIEDDIITESEVRELAAFQQLVEGRSKSRDEIIRELADQWVVRQEAAATNYREPTREEVDRAYEQFVTQFHSPAEFRNREEALGLSDAAVRRLLEQQLYLSRFLDYRFRPAAQVDPQQVEAYYNDEFVPQLKKRGEKVPPLDDVEDTIREVLIQRAINERAVKWLDDTRERLKIDIVTPGVAP